MVNSLFIKNMILALHHVAIICSDYSRSRRFYTEILGLEIISEVNRAERHSYKLDLRGPGFQIELFSFPDPPVRPTRPEARGLRHIAFAVADIEAAVQRLESFGVRCEPIRTDDYTCGRYTFFNDPDDLPLELYEGAGRTG